MDCGLIRTTSLWIQHKSVRSAFAFHCATFRIVFLALLDLSTPALNNDHQHQDEQNSGNDPDNCRIIHRISSFTNPVVQKRERRSSGVFLTCSTWFAFRYLTRVRRRWIRMTSTSTNRTPATTRIIVELSIPFPPIQTPNRFQRKQIRNTGCPMSQRMRLSLL